MKTREIVINTCYGGFGLSVKAVKLWEKLNGKGSSVYSVKRDDKNLVRVVKKLGSAANGEFSELKIVEIPADVEWHITYYDGSETVAENHRTWT